MNCHWPAFAPRPCAALCFKRLAGRGEQSHLFAGTCIFSPTRSTYATSRRRETWARERSYRILWQGKSPILAFDYYYQQCSCRIRTTFCSHLQTRPTHTTFPKALDIFQRGISSLFNSEPYPTGNFTYFPMGNLTYMTFLEGNLAHFDQI